jgi:predicted RNA-binding protein YlxR (DUF448 family)
MIKKIPQRTCVACRTTRPKRHLVRVVRLKEGGVAVDRTGKQAGRGAYLCPAQECWQLAAKRKSLEQALEVTVTADDWVTLNSYAEGLPVSNF